MNHVFVDIFNVFVLVACLVGLILNFYFENKSRQLQKEIRELERELYLLKAIRKYERRVYDIEERID